jgi:hypothetical protein
MWWHEENNKSLPPEDDGFRECPDYLNDLNAMCNAVMMMPMKQRVAYRLKLLKICEKEDVKHACAEWAAEWVSDAVDATAAQRAEAFVIVMTKERSK